MGLHVVYVGRQITLDVVPQEYLASVQHGKKFSERDGKVVLVGRLTPQQHANVSKGRTC